MPAFQKEGKDARQQKKVWPYQHTVW